MTGGADGLAPVRPASRRIFVGAAVAVAAFYALRLDDAAGLYVDDAWYIVLAQALSKGEGFRLISSAVTPLVATFPPGFPLLLAPVIAFFPDFPANVPALKAVSAAAMAGVGAALYVFLTRYHRAPRALAVTVSLLTVSIPAFVFLTTSTVMAEPVFTLCQLGVVLAVERSVRQRSGPAADIISGVLAGVTVLVRMAGVAAVFAAACYLAKRRGVRPALIFSIVAATCYLPWGAYAALNRATAAERTAHGGSVTYPYRELLAMRYGGEAASGTLTAATLVERVASNLVNIGGRDIGAIVMPAAYRPAVESGFEVFGMTGETGIRASSMGRAPGVVALSLLVSVVVLAGLRRAWSTATVAEWMVVATLMMVVLVPAPTFRYVLPLAPFFMFYFLTGLALLAGTAGRSAAAASAPRIAAAVIAVMFATEHGSYVWRAWRGPAPAWVVEYRDARQVTDWLARNGTEPVVSNNPGLVYLATGRKGMSMGDASGNWNRWRALGVRHGAALRPAPPPDPSLPHRLVFMSSNLKLWVVELPRAPLDRK